MIQTAIIHNIQELLETLPESLQIEVLHYVEYLSSRYAHQNTKQKPHIVEEKKTSELEQEKPKKRGGLGIWKGTIWMSDDFDAPLEEFEEYM